MDNIKMEDNIKLSENYMTNNITIIIVIIH